MRERNLVVVGIGAVDVIESYGVLCDHFERANSGGEDLSVDRIAQRGDQAVHARGDLINDQALRRSLGLAIDFKVVSLIAKNVEGVSNIAGGKNSDSLGHGVNSVSRIGLAPASH